MRFRVLVIIVEDSLLHPAAPLLAWLMVATSKGYRPPPRLLEAFLCVVHETAACPVRDSTDSCRRRRARPGSRCGGLRNEQDPRTAGNSSSAREGGGQQQQQQVEETKSFDADEFAVPHPKSLLVSAGGRGDATRRGGGSVPAAAADAAVANIRRALLMRVSYGGMAWDQALLKGACLAWGERCGHYLDCSCGSPACSSASPGAPAAAAAAAGLGGGSGSTGEARGNAEDMPALGSSPVSQWQQPPKPPKYPTHFLTPHGAALTDLLRSGGGSGGGGGDALPFGYAHESVLSALEGNGWTAFLAAAHGGTGMPPALRSHLMAHVAVGGNGGANGGGGSGGGGGEATRKDVKRRESGGASGESSGDDPRQGGPRRGGGVPARAVTVGPPAGRLGPLIREADAILSGVDFHCSGVLDELLRSTAVAARVGAAIQRRRGTRRQEMDPSSQAVPAVEAEKGNGITITDVTGGGGSDEEIIGVRQAAKRAMWACSGGLNVRRLRVAFSSEDEESWCGGTGGCGHGDGSEPAGCGGDGGGGCWSSPGVLEETAGARVGAGDGDFVFPKDGESLASPDMDTRVWAAMSSDVLAWTRRYVKGRLARG